MSRRTPKAHQSVSIRDVARQAGVSTATVSRVLSGSSHSVRLSTKRAVLLASSTLGYEPNRLARGLATERSQTIGVIVHDISDPYFGEIVRGMEDELARVDHQLLVASTDRDPAKEVTYLRALMAHRVDWIVLAASSIDYGEQRDAVIEAVRRFRERGGAIARLSEHIVRGPRVIVDNRGAAREMTEYILAAGHSEIAHLRGSAHLKTSLRRYEGYRDALRQRGLPVRRGLVLDGAYSLRGGETATRELLEQASFTAILASNDLMAIGAIRALLDAGVRVPEDVSVAGFDDITMAAYAPVPLTTMRIPCGELGREGAKLILAQLNGEKPEDRGVNVTLVERASVAARALEL